MTTELKTLKELGIKTNYPEVYSVLRSEAIKWMKELEIKKKPKYPNRKLIYKWERNVIQSQIKWIKHFFNLTESELK